MNDMTQVAELFHVIAGRVIDYTKEMPAPIVTEVKTNANNYATEVDVAVERIIVEAIRERFPGDDILAEEEYADGTMTDGRIWLIDPICGTVNLARNIPFYCANIALIINKSVVASCVIEVPAATYYWSVGSGIYQGKIPYTQPSTPGTLVDVDLGAAMKLNGKSARHPEAIRRLLTHPDIMLCSLSSSLAGAYVALGKISALANVDAKPWDFAAAAFLCQQADCVVTDINGSAYSVEGHSFLAAANPELHVLVRDAFAI